MRDVSYDDQDGVPKIIVTPSTEGLNFYPLLAEGGRVLLADILKPPPPVPQPVRAPQQPAAGSGAAPTETPSAGGTEETPATQPGPPLPVVALDAGHGGDDAGARGNGINEKDVVAQLVARVRLALLSTRKFRIVLTRLGDVNATFEQRAVAANVAGAAYFLTFHAGDLGGSSPRIAVYTYRPPGPPGIPERGLVFIPWNRIQNAYLEQSRQFCQTLQQQLAQMSGIAVDAPAEAPVRALRNVNTAAVAIEIGNLTPASDPGPLTSPGFQDQIATAVATALAELQNGGA